MTVITLHPARPDDDPGSHVPMIEEVARKWARSRRQGQHSAEVIAFQPRQAEPDPFCTKPGPCPCATPCQRGEWPYPTSFREAGAPAPAQPPRLPYKPPANSPPRRKPKPARKAAGDAQAQPNVHVMEQARLLAELAETWGVDLRLALAVAQQRSAKREG